MNHRLEEWGQYMNSQSSVVLVYEMEVSGLD